MARDAQVSLGLCYACGNPRESPGLVTARYVVDLELRRSMNRRSVAILLASAMILGAQSKKPTHPKRECEPTIAGGLLSSALSDGYRQYKCSDEGKWVVDEDAMRSLEAEAQSKRDLYWALRSRVLTTAEMKRVERYGIYLVLSPMQAFKEDEKQRELNDALLQQFRLRVARDEAKKEGCK
jgi:hypothetical protein